MKRKKEFSNAVAKPVKIMDSRFGIRKLYMSTKEKPSIFTYADPAPHWWGTK